MEKIDEIDPGIPTSGFEDEMPESPEDMSPESSHDVTPESSEDETPESSNNRSIFSESVRAAAEDAEQEKKWAWSSEYNRYYYYTFAEDGMRFIIHLDLY